MIGRVGEEKENQFTVKRIQVYQMYETDDLVLNKWFAVQAHNISTNTLETVKNLITHPKFDYKNPNKVRGL